MNSPFPHKIQTPKKGMAIASAQYTGKGRKMDPKRYKSNVDVYDVDSRQLVFRLQGLHYHALDYTSETQLRHTYTRMSWNPDVTFLSAAQLRKQLVEVFENSDLPDSTQALYAARRLIDLVVHKQGYVRLLERAHRDSSSSMWLDSIKPLVSETSSVGCEYRLCLPTQEADLEARTRYSAAGAVEFVVDNEEPKSPPGDEGDAFDVAIIQVCSCRLSSSGHLLTFRL